MSDAAGARDVTSDRGGSARFRRYSTPSRHRCRPSEQRDMSPYLNGCGRNSRASAAVIPPTVDRTSAHDVESMNLAIEGELVPDAEPHDGWIQRRICGDALVGDAVAVKRLSDHADDIGIAVERDDRARSDNVAGPEIEGLDGGQIGSLLVAGCAE